MILHRQMLQAVQILHLELPKHRTHLPLDDGTSGFSFANPAITIPEAWFNWPAFSSTVICFSRASARRCASSCASGEVCAAVAPDVASTTSVDTMSARDETQDGK